MLLRSSLMPCCRLRGDLVQVDITDPENPRVASRIWLGGVVRKGSPVKVQPCMALCSRLLGPGSVLRPGMHRCGTAPVAVHTLVREVINPSKYHGWPSMGTPCWLCLCVKGVGGGPAC